MNREPCNLWEGGNPCWALLECSKFVYPHCPAYQHPERPCWENAYTHSEIVTGIKRSCKNCKVFGLHRHLRVNRSASSPPIDPSDPSE